MSPVADLLDILSLERIGDNLFRGRTADMSRSRLFGGQIVAQALSAAYETVSEDRNCHSLHGYFLRPGNPRTDLIFAVKVLRDGRSFSARRVDVVQNDKLIFSATLSFHCEEAGFCHADLMPDVPHPGALTSLPSDGDEASDGLSEAVRRYFSRPRPVELRPTSWAHFSGSEPQPAQQHIWFRFCEPLPVDQLRTRMAALAYVSDMTLIDTALYPHGIAIYEEDIQGASLDHAIWFHRTIPSDGWFLYTQDSPSAHDGLGFTRGRIFTQTGTLIASTAQEGLIRRRML